MPILDDFSIPDVITLGQVAQITLQSSPTGGGALSADVSLSRTNDVMFSPDQDKVMDLSPNGTTDITLVRAPRPSLRSPSAVKLTIEIKEAGVVSTDGVDTLVDIVT